MRILKISIVHAFSYILFISDAVFAGNTDIFTVSMLLIQMDLLYCACRNFGLFIYLFVSRFVKEGQHCDEVNHGRQTKVRFECCATQHEHNLHMSTFTEAKVCSMVVLTIVLQKFCTQREANSDQIHTTRTSQKCQYEIVVCDHRLCNQHQPPNVSIAALLKPLQGVCLTM